MSWSRTVTLAELARGPVRLTLEPDAAQRAALARELDLVSLPALRAEVEVKSWLDGAEITGRFEARVEQVCGVSAEEFEQAVAGQIEVRVVPPGSQAAPGDDAGEIELDPDAPDPPDVLDGDVIDVTAYVVEHLALEIDPFPRKPDAAFEYKAEAEDDSPFAVLKRLQDPQG